MRRRNRTSSFGVRRIVSSALYDLRIAAKAEFRGSQDAEWSGQDVEYVEDEIAYTDVFPAGQVALTANATSGSLTPTVSLPAGGVRAFFVKPGPNISRVQLAAAAVFPFSFAPRMLIAIYGEALAQSTDQARSLPLPTMLSDAQVMLNGSPLGFLYVSSVQINAIAGQHSAGAGEINRSEFLRHEQRESHAGSGTTCDIHTRPKRHRRGGGDQCAERFAGDAR